MTTTTTPNPSIVTALDAVKNNEPNALGLYRIACITAGDAAHRAKEIAAEVDAHRARCVDAGLGFYVTEMSVQYMAEALAAGNLSSVAYEIMFATNALQDFDDLAF